MTNAPHTALDLQGSDVADFFDSPIQMSYSAHQMKKNHSYYVVFEVNKPGYFLEQMAKEGSVDKVIAMDELRIRTNLYAFKLMLSVTPWRKKLATYGIHSSASAFGYLMRNFFRLNASFRGQLHAILAGLGSKHRIALQVRTYQGLENSAFAPKPMALEAYWPCLARARREVDPDAHEDDFVYILSTDSPAIEAAVRAQLGARRVFQVEGRVRHLDQDKDFNFADMRKMMLDWYLLGEAHHGVLAPTSGFGIFAYFRKRHSLPALFPSADKAGACDASRTIYQRYIA